MRSIVVMPTYNERQNIEEIIRVVLSDQPQWHVLVVDDNSPDGTGDVVDELAKHDACVHVIHRAGKYGLGTAYREGLSWALRMEYDYICTMDSDFSHNPKVLPRLRQLAEQYGVAHGSRYISGGSVENWSRFRRAVSLMANALTRRILGLNLADCTSGFRCYRRDVLELMDVSTLTARGYAIMEELTFRCTRAGFRPAEFPITFMNRRAGRSKLNSAESLRALGAIFQLRLQGWRPEKNGAKQYGSQ